MSANDFQQQWVAEDSYLISFFSAGPNIVSFAAQIHQQVQGLLDVVVAEQSLLLVFMPCADIRDLPLQLKQIYATSFALSATPQQHQLAACYDPEFSLDLNDLSQHLQLPTQAIVDLHLSTCFTVSAIGFAPGFAYLSGLPKALQLPRKAKPRTRVAKGSIAIAANMSAVYPQASPGGWHIIGRSPESLFSPDSQPACPFKVGDKIQFRAISKQQYLDWPAND